MQHKPNYQQKQNSIYYVKQIKPTYPAEKNLRRKKRSLNKNKEYCTAQQSKRDTLIKKKKQVGQEDLQTPKKHHKPNTNRKKESVEKTSLKKKVQHNN